MALSIAVPPARCQSSGGGTEIQFDIPAQPLDGALEAYMHATGLQVLYKSELTAASISADVKGRFTPTQALGRMLAGTRLRAVYTAADAFTVVPAELVGTEAVRVQAIASYDLYLGNAQRRIIAALCKDAATQPGSYRAALQFSITPSGKIGETFLLDTTGDPARDQSIAGELNGLPVGQAPPAGMRQPITMLVTPRTRGEGSECQQSSR